MSARPYILGLTGSIGMGKSTLLGFFQELGIPVWDADNVVHSLYEKGGAGVRALENLAPEAILDGKISRKILKEKIETNSNFLQEIEAIIHPLVANDRSEFIAKVKKDGAKLLVCDIPLLFETVQVDMFDGILVATAPTSIQRKRVLARVGMSEAQLEDILNRQLPDAEKRERADFVIKTVNVDDARQSVTDLVDKLMELHDA